MTEPLLVHEGTVQPDWIDYNGHMRDGYYAVACSTATDKLMDQLGVDQAYRERTQGTLYTLEAKIRFVAEAGEGEAFTISAQILDADAKRLHIHMRMCRAGSGELLATQETVLLHVDQAAGPAAAPFPPEIAQRVEALEAAHRALPFPEDASRPIGLRRKPTAG